MKDNLRHSASTFVGRAAELTRVRRLLTEHRLVTLSGIGGSGKTRLAMSALLQLRSKAAEDGVDALWWVDLGGVTDPGHVAHVCAAAVGARLDQAGDPLAALSSACRDARAVVCLDTCEHVLDAAAQTASHLLTTCPGVSVLTTSREPLNLPGEAVWRVPPLTASDAYDLFVERSDIAGSALDPAKDATTIDAICDRVDRLPLAIELAAAWTRLLRPADLLDGLANRYAVLTGGERRGPERHQAMRASMEWSHGLLNETERTVLRRLAVFAGPFELDAATEVCGFDVVPAEDFLGIFARLVDKSLVMSEAGDDGRFRLLDSVREYARERLEEANETDQVRDRHLSLYAAEAVAVDRGLQEDQDRWRSRGVRIAENVASALDWALRGSPRQRARAAELAEAMRMPWLLSGQTTVGLSYLERAARAVDDPAVQARVRSAASVLEIVAGRRVPGAVVEHESPQAASEPEQRSAEPDVRVRARRQMAEAFYSFFVDFDRCERMGQVAAQSGEAAGDWFVRDFSLLMAAYSLNARDRFEPSFAMGRPALERSRARGDRFCTAFGLGLEQFAALQTGDLAGAVRIGREMVETIAPLSEYFGLGTLTSNLALAHVRRGEIEAVRHIMRPIVDSLDSAPDVDVVGFQVPLGHASLHEGRWQEALDWFSRALSRLERADVDWTAARCLAGAVAALRELGRTEEAAALLNRGLALSRLYDAPNFHADLADQEALLVVAADPAKAFDLYHRALAIRRDAGLWTYVPDSLDALAGLTAATDPSAQAARLLAASGAARSRIGRPRTLPESDRHAQTTRLLRAALGATTFNQAWTEGSQLSMGEAADHVARGRGTRSRPRTGWSSLTRAELEVVRKVVAGRSNSEIAEELYVSRSTVKTHLAHAFAKLNVANRTELAIYAATHGDLADDDPGPRTP